ncbi:MAG TPA: xanthine dehydrogenase family protein molybdopterin-binding subunit [Noviherbaspirillum sp.]|jgi:xanthine dehydrogenase YagR molybdenum-binding subunit|uniref:xanthine dehydrogenase family protein molybdopterin-binding subunit n=1 Tax=Noviherbaspirillum sp. TaxID=1926288 RepID=UPI002DDD76A0|nr:xanthine dehydrogenase family protein molybdopterin-binding subunit [Noviherbaspirillum sp.]HEV2609224.1 xanthine dehydrogenase family protein molybdopterin-binding subunit [Noviherbaspirillum sp.]
MKFDSPATTNPIDQLKVVGQPVDRIDGRLKTTGTAPYAYDRYDVVANQAYGYVVGSAIAKGRIVSMDLSAARAAPGVITIVTAQNAGKLGKGDLNVARLLGGPEVQHYHQAIAVVVADTFEQARAAASMVRVEYTRSKGAFDLASSKDKAVAADSFSSPGASSVGNFAGAFASAPVQLDATYSTAHESHSMLEPHASIAAWEGDRLTLWTSNQMIAWTVNDLAKTLGIPKEKVRVMSPYIGGGFGAKLFLRSDALMAALAARAAGRPVKVALQRALVPNNTVHRSATIQRVRIGAERNGQITAIGHESWSGNLQGGGLEAGAIQTRLLYAGANRMTANRLAALDLPEANAMRAPNEAPGLAVLEIAMDEMAEKLNMDPIEFRIRNDTQVVPDYPAKPGSNDPQSKKPEQQDKQDKPNPHPPFSKRQLVQCFQIGAKRFGWEKRNTKPGQARDGQWLIGMGVAAAFRDNLVTKSAARVRLDRRGNLTVETDMTDIGTGSYTIIAQTAAEMMGLPLEKVTVRLGDSSFPVSCGSGGQWGGNSSTSGVYAACMKLREAVAQKAGFNAADAVFADGRIRSGSRDIPLAEVAGSQGIVAEDMIEFGDLDKKYQQSTFGAHFVEVAVDADTGETRVRRMLAVCAAGRILNPKTARSQVIGAMTMGVGAALMEALAVDTRYGFFVNHDLAGYEVPVHADIPHQEVIFLDETDPISSPMKAKGVGELGICGIAAAVANAVYNATGVRVRDYPITLDKLIEKMPPAV